MSPRHAGTRLRVASVLGLLVHSLAVWAGTGGDVTRPPALEEIVARVQAQYDRIPHLHARFHQETRMQGFDQVQLGEGEVWIRKPGMMRWDYTKPERQTIIANGETLWIYLPEDRQVIRDRMSDSLQARTPALFLAGRTRLTDLFAPTGPAVQTPGEDGLLRLELTPQEGHLQLSRVRLGIHPRSYLVVEVRLIDPLGNVTTMRFSDIQTDVPVDPSLFQFQVPPGVDVVTSPPFPEPR